jgi:hypothetical protein
MKKKAVSCLKVYLKSGGNTKDAPFQNLVTSVFATRELEEKAAWQPLNFMVQRYGVKELKARVLAGTIECRKNPSDPRFPEFRDLVESDMRKITKQDTSSVQVTKKASSADFLAMANMEVNEMNVIQFAEEADDPDSTESLMKSFFGKPAAAQPKPLPIKGIELDDGDQFFKDLETASAIEDTTPLSVATLKLLQVKTLCKTVEEELSTFVNDHPKYKVQGNKCKDEVKEQLKLLAACEKNVKAKSMKAGVLKKLLVVAAGVAKRAKQFMMKVQ